MKKVVLGFLAVIATASLMACNNQKEIVPQNNIPVVEDKDNNVSEVKKLTKEEMYSSLIGDYKKAISEYDIDDIEIDEKINNKYPLISSTLLMHITRYAKEGVELTYNYYDIDKNGVDELLVGASDSIGAIYTYDSNLQKVIKIFFQDTMERGTLSLYDNGIILSEGSGGAALHYYEFGRIASDGLSYELIESIEEEYINENETPIYRNAKTGEELSYSSLEEIMEKYIYSAKKNIIETCN